MHAKGEFSKIKGNIINVPVDTENICNILPRSCDSNGLIIVKLKRHMKYQGHVFFEPVWPSMIFEALEYLKTHMFYEDMIISLGLTSDEILDFSKLSVTQSIGGTLEDENFEEAEDPGNLDRTATAEASLISEVLHLVDENKIILAPGQNETPLSILSDDHCEELAFPHLFPGGKFGYRVEREVPLSPVKYFNQRHLNFKQILAADPDYIFFARSIVEQCHLKSSINIALQKIRCSELTASSIKGNCKDSIKQLSANDNTFSFMSSVKGTPAYWKQFLLGVLANGKTVKSSNIFLNIIMCRSKMG